jgi:hypothetical protein
MSNKKVIARAFYQGQGKGEIHNPSYLRVIEETLSDGSLVYNIELGPLDDYFEIFCESEQDAYKRYGQLLRIEKPHEYDD